MVGAVRASPRSTIHGEFLKGGAGFDRQHGGPANAAFTMTLDGGCGYGGKALAGLP